MQCVIWLSISCQSRRVMDRALFAREVTLPDRMIEGTNSSWSTQTCLLGNGAQYGRSSRCCKQFIHTEVEVARISLAARRFIKDEEGAALAEYGILVAFIAIVAITAVTFFGSKISAKFSSLATSFT